MQVSFEIKKGSTIQQVINVSDDSGNLIIGKASSLQSQIRDIKNELIAEFTITETEVDGKYLLTILDTSTFPVGYLYFDIRYDVDGVISKSPTYAISVVNSVTEAVTT